MVKKSIPSGPNPGYDAQPETGKSGQPSPPDYEPIYIDTHRGLITEQPELFKRFNEHPELSRLLFINPVLAFKEINVRFSPAIGTHVLHTLQHDTTDRERRAELEQKLRDELGEPPQPTNAAWLARTLFEKLKLQPLRTGSHTPTFRPPLNEEILARLQALRPKPRKPVPPPKGPGYGSGVRLASWSPSIRRLDLAAPAPELKPAKKPPRSVSLEDLWFYKDISPVAHDLLELGLIQKRGINFHTSAGYRKIRSGQRHNAFLAWISAVKFPEEEAGPG